MSEPRRVLFVGFDAFDVDVARGLIDAGRLPALQRFWDEAASARVDNPPGFVVGAVWPSLWSGTLPSRNGYFANRQLVNGTYEVCRTTPNELDVEPFWGAVARAGRRAYVLDVPLAPLRPFPNCVQIVDWGVHDRILGLASSPPSAHLELEREVGAHTMREGCDDYAARGAWTELRDDLLRGVAQRTEATKRALADPDIDLVVSVYGESHCAGHNLWGTPELMTEIYDSIDRAFAELLEAVDAGTTVVLLLSHGIEPPYGCDHVMGEILRRLDQGYGPPSRFVSVRERVARPAARRWHERRPPTSLADGPFSAGDLTSVDSSRRFFAVPTVGLHSYVRFNVKGREPRGRVAPGAELDGLIEKVSTDLLDLVDPETGLPVVARVLRTRDLYDGVRVDALPDLCVEWSAATKGDSAASDRVGVVRGPRFGTRAAEHRSPGHVLVRGPSLQPGPVTDTVRAVDVAPTVLAMLGASPGEIDGRAIPALVPTS